MRNVLSRLLTTPYGSQRLPMAPNSSLRLQTHADPMTPNYFHRMSLLPHHTPRLRSRFTNRGLSTSFIFRTQIRAPPSTKTSRSTQVGRCQPIIAARDGRDLQFPPGIEKSFLGLNILPGGFRVRGRDLAETNMFRPTKSLPSRAAMIGCEVLCDRARSHSNLFSLSTLLRAVKIR